MWDFFQGKIKFKDYNVQFSNKSLDALKNMNSTKDYDSSFVSLAMNKIFKVSEMINHSVTGKKGKTVAEKKPALNKLKFALLKSKSD